ncbi:LnmK family bifunctional acyltransferase/decarboxylase [Micromonospora profundi]|uniref:LnmK family bifunctional acyltransferase/decarboxylase n=1 Tax=Micromonospora profundi TaxID=1420889 RepID=UPI0033A360A0
MTPSMCGSSSLFFGQVGDWTWEAVGAACDTDVYRARNAEGSPSYLSFYYFHTASRGALQPYGLTFGDELDVASRVFDFGSHSVLTLHRLSAAGTVGDDGALDPVEFYERPRADCIYVENFNRWVSRSRAESNQALIEAAPPEFRHAHLPRLPSAYSPRGVAGCARENGTFHPAGISGFDPGEQFVTRYELDVVRDINGVGLVYFASYFSIVDTALLRLWRELGRTDRAFRGRRLLDHRLGYFANADIESAFAITIRLWRSVTEPEHEIADVSIRHAATGGLLAVASVETELVGGAS